MASQGSPISPLLANLYMRRFVLGWRKLGLDRSLGTRIVIMGKLKLTVNEEKTRICKVPEGEFDFLG